MPEDNLPQGAPQGDPLMDEFMGKLGAMMDQKLGALLTRIEQLEKQEQQPKQDAQGASPAQPSGMPPTPPVPAPDSLAEAPPAPAAAVAPNPMTPPTADSIAKLDESAKAMPAQDRQEIAQMERNSAAIEAGCGDAQEGLVAARGESVSDFAERFARKYAKSSPEYSKFGSAAISAMTKDPAARAKMISQIASDAQEQSLKPAEDQAGIVYRSVNGFEVPVGHRSFVHPNLNPLGVGAFSNPKA